MENRVLEVKDANQQKLNELKRTINNMINKLYDDICKTAFGMDKYRIPLHGIASPQYENPMNLF